MTGFARATSDGDPVIEVQVRAVNHRFLDLKIRTPTDLESCDPMIRQLVKEKVRRGALQVSVSLRAEGGSSISLNQDLAQAYLKAYQQLAGSAKASPPPDLTAILRIPGVVSEQQPERTAAQQKKLEKRFEAVLGEALDRLNEARQTEGDGIEKDVRERAKRIGAEAKEVLGQVKELVPDFQERLRLRLEELLGESPIEPQRILQEAAILADRADVSEELQRLSAHVQRIHELFGSEEEVGKQLDFLAQELNREANTLLSKTNAFGEAGLPVTAAGLRLKGEIEKIREQAQNLE